MHLPELWQTLGETSHQPSWQNLPAELFLLAAWECEVSPVYWAVQLQKVLLPSDWHVPPLKHKSWTNENHLGVIDKDIGQENSTHEGRSKIKSFFIMLVSILLFYYARTRGYIAWYCRRFSGSRYEFRYCQPPTSVMIYNNISLCYSYTSVQSAPWKLSCKNAIFFWNLFSRITL